MFACVTLCACRSDACAIARSAAELKIRCCCCRRRRFLYRLLPSSTPISRNIREIEVDLLAISTKFQHAQASLQEAAAFIAALERRKILIDQVFAASFTEASPSSSLSQSDEQLSSSSSIIPSNSSAYSAVDRPPFAPSISSPSNAPEHFHIVRTKKCCFTFATIPSCLSSNVCLKVPAIWNPMRRAFIDQVNVALKSIRGLYAACSNLFLITSTTRMQVLYIAYDMLYHTISLPQQSSPGLCLSLLAVTKI